ncbi:PRA1 family protein [Plasmodiophora brassicae]
MPQDHHQVDMNRFDSALVDRLAPRRPTVLEVLVTLGVVVLNVILWDRLLLAITVALAVAAALAAWSSHARRTWASDLHAFCHHFAGIVVTGLACFIFIACITATIYVVAVTAVQYDFVRQRAEKVTVHDDIDDRVRSNERAPPEDFAQMSTIPEDDEEFGSERIESAPSEVDGDMNDAQATSRSAPEQGPSTAEVAEPELGTAPDGNAEQLTADAE